MRKFFTALVRRTPFLYHIWFAIVRKWKGDSVRLPRRSDVIYFDGFPRSGNTYVANLIRFAFKNIDFASHLHCVAPIKMALKRGLVVFIIVRHPLEAIGSLLFTKVNGNRLRVSDRLIEEVLDFYVRFHSFLLKHKGRYRLLCFPDVLENLGAVLDEISVVVGRAGNEEEMLQTINEFDKMMKAVEKRKAVRSGSLPNNERNIFKQEVRARITDFSQYDVAQNLYFQLVRC